MLERFGGIGAGCMTMVPVDSCRCSLVVDEQLEHCKDGGSFMCSWASYNFKSLSSFMLCKNVFASTNFFEDTINFDLVATLCDA